VIREPAYSEQAAAALDDLERGADARLLDAVADTLDLICDHGDSAEARRTLLRVGDASVWRVAVRGTDWVVLWWPFADEARIYYIGPS
jgi:hypothetical protein